MKKQEEAALTVLKQDELDQVAGAGIGPLIMKVPQAQDVWGNTLSHEEWMERKVRTANGSGEDPHDFYSDGFDQNKPHIWG